MARRRRHRGGVAARPIFGGISEPSRVDENPQRPSAQRSRHAEASGGSKQLCRRATALRQAASLAGARDSCFEAPLTAEIRAHPSQILPQIAGAGYADETSSLLTFK